jgi:hypothetical protein
VVALHRAVAFVEGEDIAVLVGGHLNLDVAHRGEQLFHVQARVAEGRLGQRRSLGEGRLQLVLGKDLVDAASAAAALGLEHDREADLLGYLAGLGHAHRFGRPRHYRDAQFFCQLAHGHLVAQGVHGLASGADEGDARLGALGRKGVVLGREAPARMDGDRAPVARQLDDQVEIQIGARIFP